MGIASEIPSGEESLEILISQADQALYIAKSQGRNQAIVY
jgi:PleD family two-component response regulator